MKVVFLILACALMGIAADSSGGPSDEAIRDAFLKSPEIVQAKAEVSANGFESADIRVIPFGSLCGAAGCQSSVLVIQELNRKGTNPNSMSLMCLVHIGPKGNITSVKRVVFVPFAESDHKN